PNKLDKVSSNSESETDSYIYKITKRVKDLKKQLEQNYSTLTVKEYNYKRAIFEYLSLLSNNNGHSKIKACLEVAQKLLSSRYRKHQKIIRIIDDKDIEIKCNIWIKSQNFKITLAIFKKFIKDELFPSVRILKKKTVSLKTTGIYYDGHEREDILEYKKTFLEKIFKHEKYMSKYEDEFMERIHPILPQGEKERVLVVYDECIFYSNDGKQEIDGCLCLQQSDIERYSNISKEAKCYLIPSANQEAVFTFDNSSNHDAFSEDTLIASRMNLGSDGKQLIMHDTYFGKNNQIQSIVFLETDSDIKLYEEIYSELDKKLQGKPKGIKQVLTEREKWPSEGLVLDCKKCKEKIKDTSRVSCYAY
ncbi:817_t:CDS:2, partial [Scutellospora calospora]